MAKKTSKTASKTAKSRQAAACPQPKAELKDAGQTAKSLSAARRPVAAVRRTAGRARRYVSAKLVDRRSYTPHRSFRLTRRSELPHYRPVPAWWRLAGHAVKQLWQVKTTVILLLGLYALLAWLVNGAETIRNFDAFRGATANISFGSIDDISNIATQVNAAIATLGSQDSAVQLLMGLIQILFWLAFIWLTRHAFAAKPTTLRETIYLSGSSLVTTVLVVLIIVAQAMPGILGAVLGATLFKGWGLDTAIQSSFFAVLAVLLIVLSAYLIVSGLVALQIIALPGMFPYRALRDARTLVAGRRFATLRKYLAIPLILVLAWVVLVLPLIVAENSWCTTSDNGICLAMPIIIPTWVQLVTAMSIGFASAYAYVLYRSLLSTRDTA